MSGSRKRIRGRLGLHRVCVVLDDDEVIVVVGTCGVGCIGRRAGRPLAGRLNGDLIDVG